MTFANVMLAALPAAGLAYGFVLLKRDIQFYRRYGFDYSKNSGVPDFWVRLGPWRHVLTPQQRFRFGYPLFLSLCVALIVLFMFVKFGKQDW
jgi:hypothetical protein